MSDATEKPSRIRVQVPESMTRFRCNQKGCCCKGWKIWFRPTDLARLNRNMSQDEFDEMLQDATLQVSDDGTRLTGFRLRTVGAEEGCQFLDEGRCGLQVRRGASVLPDLCLAFPAHSLVRNESYELHYTALCPEVLERLDEGDTPYDVVDLEVEPDSDLGVRTTYWGKVGEVKLGERPLSNDELAALRDSILKTLVPSDEPALHQLGRIHYALAPIARGADPATFKVDPTRPVLPFLAYFDRCVAIHHAAALRYMFFDYERFVFVIDLNRIDPGQFLEELDRVRDTWDDHVPFDAPELQGLVRRYLAHRFFSPFTSSPDHSEMFFSYGSITHCVATAFRLAAGLRRCLPDVSAHDALKVGLGASEYFYRTLPMLKTSSMIWFEPEA